MEKTKFVLLLNENGDNTIIKEFNNLSDANKAFEKLDTSDLREGQEYELCKYDLDNQVVN